MRMASYALAAFTLASVWMIGTRSMADESKKVLKHIVMYKFKDEATPAQVQEVIDTFAGLPKKVDTIIGFEHGENVSKEGKSDGLTHCFVVTFRDQEGLEKYLKHPAHDAYVKVVAPRREKVVVFDYWSEP
ncbi:MAG: Dabb family protein [Planctomycetota bacterium]